jgi:hypothetical protein
MSESVGRRPSAPPWIVPALAFAAFGGLVGWRIGAGALAAGLGAIVGVLFALVAAYLLVLALRLAQPRLGGDAARQAVATGFLLLLPFAVLSMAAELYLGWSASQAFSSAGLMTAGGAVGVEVARRGGGRWRSMLVPSLLCFALASLWTIAGASIPGLLGVAK